MIRHFFWQLSLFLLLFTGEGNALPSAFKANNREVRGSSFLINIKGVEKATVSRKSVFLKDIASIEGSQGVREKDLIELENLTILSNLQPGDSVRLNGESLVQKLKSFGVDFSVVGYALPREIAVSRAFRELNQFEVKDAIKKWAQKNGVELEVKNVKFPSGSKVFTGLISVDVKRFESGFQGKGYKDALIEIRNDDGEVLTKNVQVASNEWAEVTVASRLIPKGSIVDFSSLGKARMKLDELPNDAMVEGEMVIGTRATRDIKPGDIFRGFSIEAPPAVEKGMEVKGVVVSGLLTAEVKGVALESGQTGQSVKVRNTVSNKVFEGIVTGEGVVEVRL